MDQQYNLLVASNQVEEIQQAFNGYLLELYGEFAEVQSILSMANDLAHMTFEKLGSPAGLSIETLESIFSGRCTTETLIGNVSSKHINEIWEYVVNCWMSIPNELEVFAKAKAEA